MLLQLYSLHASVCMRECCIRQISNEIDEENLNIGYFPMYPITLLDMLTVIKFMTCYDE